MEYKGFGTVTLEVSKLIEANSEEEAIHNLLSKLSTYGVEEISLDFKTSDGEIHKIKIHDHDINWVEVIEVESVGKEKATKQTA